MAGRPYWTKSKVTETLRHAPDRPKVRDYRGVDDVDLDLPSYSTIMRLFGSWDAALKASGWEPRGRGRPRRTAQVAA